MPPQSFLCVYTPLNNKFANPLFITHNAIKGSLSHNIRFLGICISEKQRLVILFFMSHRFRYKQVFTNWTLNFKLKQKTSGPWSFLIVCYRAPSNVGSSAHSMTSSVLFILWRAGISDRTVRSKLFFKRSESLDFASLMGSFSFQICLSTFG